MPRPIGTKLRKGGILEASHSNQESPLPMKTITQMPSALQTLFTTTADDLAKKQASFNASEN